jgi:O-antigen/teichoic acid export membrane protein
MGFSERVRRGTVANILRQAIHIGSEVAVVPVALAGWGEGLYGEWQVLSAAMMYIMVLDFGTHTYAINRMNQCYATGQLKELARNLHTALAIALLAGGLGLAAAILMSSAMPITEWFHLTLTSDSRAKQVLALVAVHAALALPAGVIAGVYRAVGEYARDIMVNNVYRLATCILTAVLILLEGGILAVAWMQLICYSATLAFIILDIRRRHQRIRIGLAQTDFRLMKSFLLPSSMFFAIQAATASVVYGMVLIVANTAGAAAVAAFTITRTLVNAIPQVVNSISGTLWPEFTAMEARGDHRRLASLHLLAAKTILWLGIASAVFLHYTAADIVALWTGSRIQFDQRLVDALLLLELTATWTLASQTVLAAANRPRILAISQLLASGLGLALGYGAAVYWGAMGVAAGVLAANLLTMAWIVPASACRLLGASGTAFTWQVLQPAIAILGTLFVVVGLCGKVMTSTGAGAVFVLWICTGVCSLLLFRYVWLTQDEWNLLKTFLPLQIKRPPLRSTLLMARRVPAVAGRPDSPACEKS